MIGAGSERGKAIAVALRLHREEGVTPHPPMKAIKKIAKRNVRDNANDRVMRKHVVPAENQMRRSKVKADKAPMASIRDPCKEWANLKPALCSVNVYPGYLQ